VPKAVLSLKRQGPARMGEIWPLLAPLEALGPDKKNSTIQKFCFSYFQNRVRVYL
jgi:hypothetical protein